MKYLHIHPLCKMLQRSRLCQPRLLNHVNGRENTHQRPYHAEPRHFGIKRTHSAQKTEVLPNPVCAGDFCHCAGCAARPFLSRYRREHEAFGRCFYQAGKNDHCAGDFPHCGYRHRRHEQYEIGQPRGRQGDALFCDLFHAGLDCGHDCGQCGAAGRRPAHRSGQPARRQSGRICGKSA